MRRAGSSRPASTTLASNSDGDAEAGAVTSPQKGRGVSRVKQVSILRLSHFTLCDMHRRCA